MSSARVTIERLIEASATDVDDINVLLRELKPAWPAINLVDLEAVLASPSRVDVARLEGMIVGLTLLVPHRHFGWLRCHVEDVA